MDGSAEGHRTAVERVQRRYAASPKAKPPRPAAGPFRRSGSSRRRARRLDLTALSGVTAVDTEARTATAGGATTYGDLLASTLRHGFVPAVVPHLQTITLGDAIVGSGIASSSFREGCAHESVFEVEVLTGDGRVVTAAPGGEHGLLYRGIAGSRGALGYVLGARIELRQARDYVRVRHVRCFDAGEVADLFAEVGRSGTYLGGAVDFVEGTVFTPRQNYVTLGTFTDRAPKGTSDYPSRSAYRGSIPWHEVDHLTTRDYLWRWDSGRPRRWRHHGPGVYRGVLPAERLAEFLDFVERVVGTRPVWLCPLRLASGEPWPLYPLEPGRNYVDVGFRSAAWPSRGASPGRVGRLVGAEVARLGGQGSPYPTSHSAQAGFREPSGGDTYRRLKKEYDPDGRLPDLDPR